MMVKLELRGLTCANCAAKIEHQVKELPEVKEGTLDLMNQKIHIDLNKSKDAESVIDKTREIVQLLEPHVEVIPMEGGSSFKKEEKTAFFTAVKDYTKENPFVVIGFGLFLFAVLLQMPRNIEIAVYMLAYILVGGKVVLTAAKNILKGQVFDEHFLMAIATVGALLLGEFPEAVAVMVFWQIGEAFQDYAVNNSRKNIKGLLDLKAEFANLATPEGLQKVDPAVVKVGDIVTIKPGEKVPLDGIVIKGSAKMDTSSLTGESVPRGVNVDDQVLSGYINTDSVIDVKVTKLLAESTAARILDLVENASAKKSRTEQFITRFARYYTPVVVILAALLAFVAPLIIPGANFAEWVERALIFLVVSCPCGLVISIPLGFFGGIGAASNHGILVKGGNYLETLNSVTHVVFDKTGTLTKGVFKVTDTHIANGMDEEAFLKAAASVELHSNHPIAKSIRNAYGKHVDESTISDFKEISGQGITAFVEGIPVSVGNATLMKSQGIEYTAPNTVGTVVHVSIDNAYAGYMIIADEIKDGVMDLTKQLHKAGIKKAIMLTGDHTSIAQEITHKLGLDDFRAELLPGDKVDEFERIKNSVGKKERVAFVGDGINDAPVLARADIGMSMGGVGSDAAIEASDIVLMTDEPKKIAEAKLIANKTKVIVWQNIVFALGIKVAVLLLATLGMTNMWMAIFADVGVALLAILNASRILKTNVEFK